MNENLRFGKSDGNCVFWSMRWKQQVLVSSMETAFWLVQWKRRVLVSSTETARFGGFDQNEKDTHQQQNGGSQALEAGIKEEQAAQ